MHRKYGFMLMAVMLVLFAGCPDGDFDKLEFSITGGTFEHGDIAVRDNLGAAAKGKTVTLVALPDLNDDRYYLTSVTVTGKDGYGTVIPVSGGWNVRTFTMPAEPVKVTAASFEAADDAYSVYVTGQYVHGKAGGGIDGSKYTKVGYAKPGTTVTLFFEPDPGYYLANVIIIKRTSDERIDAVIDSAKKEIRFTMPDDDEGVELTGPNQSEPEKSGALFLPIGETFVPGEPLEP